MADTKMQMDSIPQEDVEMVRRVGRAWREIRRGATASDARDVIYGVGGSAIEPGQMDALDLLVSVDSCRMGDIAEYLRIDPSTATRSVQRLIKDNLAERVEHEGDARVVHIAATERGRRIHSEVFERRRGVILAVMEQFTGDERDQMVKMLEKFAIAVDEAVKSKRFRPHH